MAEVAANVFIPGDGIVAFAAAGTTLPTSATASISAFGELGYIHEDGVTYNEPTATNKVKAFQRGDVVSEAETEHSFEIEFTCLEINEEVLDLAYAGNYTPLTGAGQVKGGQSKRGVWIFDAIDGDNNMIRRVIPDGKIVERKTVTMKNGEPWAIGLKLQCFADSNGVKSYDYYIAVGAS